MAKEKGDSTMKFFFFFFFYFMQWTFARCGSSNLTYPSLPWVA
jgi:hypothetical protein